MIPTTTNRQGLAGGSNGSPGTGATAGGSGRSIPLHGLDCQPVQPDDLRRYAAGLLAEATLWLDIAGILEGMQ